MKLMSGNIFTDNRGILKFLNDFNMSSIVRMYSIEPKLGLIRAWQGHKLETKWFYAVKGSFLVKTINMKTLFKSEYHLNSLIPSVLEIEGGYFNGFESLEAGSILIVYSNFDLNKSKQDDFRVGIDKYPW